jgi:hypothetical protein
MPGASRDTHVAANPRAVHGDFITVAHHGRRRAPDADLARIERRVDQPDWMSVKVAFLQRTFAVPNLYLADGSLPPTQGSANPALTIMSVAARLADHLVGARHG